MRTGLLISLMIIFCSCGRKDTNDSSDADSIIEIDLLSEPESKVKKLSEFAANIEYIPLQTTENSLMSSNNVRKIINTNKKIYINNFEGILCFNMDGKFLFKLDNRGRGPGEYTSIFDFDISSDNKYLTIPNYSKLLLYGISDTGFSFQRTLTLKDPFLYKARIVPETENIFLPIPPWRGTEQTLSLLINLFGNTIHFKPNIYKYKMVRRTGEGIDEMQVYSIGKMVCFKEEFSDTVFYIDAKNSSFKPRLILNSHGTIITPERRGGLETAKEVRSSVNNIFETSRYVFYLCYIRDNQNRFLENRILFDKKTKIKYKLDIESRKSQLMDDLIGGPDFNIDYLNFYCSEGKLFSFVEAITLKKYVGSEDFKNVRVSDPKKKNDLKKLADSLNETDNPVLIILTPNN
jgi:hypothetical protein